MAVFTPPGFYDFIMDLDGDGVNDIEQFLALRKQQVGNGSTAPTPTRKLKIRVPRKTKQTRKVSAYQKRFGINLKKLKKAHPRTSISVLMKKAHRMTRRDRK